jgi:hypothetical protein
MNSTATKTCTFCKEEKTLDKFPKYRSQKDGLHYYCKACVRQINQAYKENNPGYFENYRSANQQKLREYQQRYKMKNSIATDEDGITTAEHEKQKKRHRESERRKNPEYIAARRSYFKNKYLTDRQFKLKKQLESKLNKLFKDNDATQKSRELIGTAIPEFKKFLETKFLSGMSHENYGTVWCFRHVIPFSHYDLTNEDEVRECLHYSNFEPILIRNIDGVTGNSNNNID